jgi:Ca2+-binding RTX toxin-like protein
MALIEITSTFNPGSNPAAVPAQINFRNLIFPYFFAGSVGSSTSLMISGTSSGRTPALTATFTGTGFVYDGQGILIGGTVTGFTLVDNLGLSSQSGTFQTNTITVMQTSFNASDLGFATTGNFSRVADLLLRINGGEDTINGSQFADIIIAGSGRDFVFGGNGDDQITGGSGQNFLRGDAGNDTITGGNDFDELEGGDGNDILDGGNGTNRLFGGRGNDSLIGGTGEDSLVGGDGDDFLVGGDSDDVLEGDGGGLISQPTSGNDRLFGGNGNDRLSGGPGIDNLDGGNGNDTIFGNEGRDSIFGRANDDTVYGGSGDDSIFGDEGNDRLFGNEGDDTIFGGEGDDELNGNDNNDSLYGSSGNDYIVGEDGDDLLFGNEGSDWIIGGNGNDFLVGDDGFDTLIGGDGDDGIVYDANDNLAAYDGGAGYDTLFVDVAQGGIPVPINLAAQGFEQAIFTQNDTENQPWNQIITIYDGLWRVKTTEFIQDDGSRSIWYFDFDGSLQTREFRTYLTASGDTDFQQIFNDDGSVLLIDFDLANTEQWSIRRLLQDANGAILSDSYVADALEVRQELFKAPVKASALPDGGIL